jgi:thiosulfate/3-mercaptopyruvate sulfurtransferase
MNKNYSLVTVDWLHENLDDENLVILDASMDKVLGKEPLVYDHFFCIKGAQKCDIEQAFHDSSSNQPNTMPTAEQFTLEVQKLGVHADSIVVVYDNQGIYCSPRAWWMFKIMGHIEVFILDGGLPKWISENLIFDQLILEFYDGVDPNSGWVHCSYVLDGSNRSKTMTALRVNGKTQYKLGLLS